MDRRALFIGSSYYGLKYVDTTIENYFKKPQLYLEGQKQFQDRFSTDIVSCPVYTIGEVIQFGSTIKLLKDTPPILKETAYERNVDIEKIKPSTDSAYYEYIFETARLLKRELPEKQISAFLVSPVDLGIIVFGLTKWIDMFVFEPERFDQWLIKFIYYHDDYKMKLIELGVNHIMVSNILLNNRIVSDKLIEKRIIPILNQYVRKEPAVLVHSSYMPVKEAIKHLEKVNNTGGYLINESDNILDIKKIMDPNKILAGNMVTEFLYKRYPKTIEDNVYRTLMDTEDYKVFILSTAGADLNLQTTEEQINAIYKGIEKYERRD